MFSYDPLESSTANQWDLSKQLGVCGHMLTGLTERLLNYTFGLHCICAVYVYVCIFARRCICAYVYVYVEKNSLKAQIMRAVFLDRICIGCWRGQ